MPGYFGEAERPTPRQLTWDSPTQSHVWRGGGDCLGLAGGDEWPSPVRRVDASFLTVCVSFFLFVGSAHRWLQKCQLLCSATPPTCRQTAVSKLCVLTYLLGCLVICNKTRLLNESLALHLVSSHPQQTGG